MIRRLRIAALGAALASAAVAVVPDAASAHGLVGRQDLPIPRWLFAWGAAVVLVISFVALAVLWPKPRLEDAAEHRVLRVPAFLEPICGVIGVAAFAGMVYAGFAGTQAATANIEPTVIYVLFWVGLPFLSACSAISSRRSTRGARPPRFVAWVAGRVSGDTAPGADGLSRVARPLARRRSASSPSPGSSSSTSAATIRAFSPRSRCSTPRRSSIGMSVYGIATWTHRADAFASTSTSSRSSRRCTGGTAPCTADCRWRARRTSTSCPARSRCCAR